MSELISTKDKIRTKAKELGFDAVGFAPATLNSSHGTNLKRYVDEGRHGTMGWMETRQFERASPDQLWSEAKSVLVLGTNYGPTEPPTLADSDRATISCYALNRDYHDVVKKRLKQLGRWLAVEFNCELKVFVDTAPVMEKPLAQLAGLGWQGKHTNLVSREFGSWLFLGEVFLDFEVEPDTPEVDHCGACTACLDICPTGALTPYKIDARKCISYLTIEHNGDIDAGLAAQMDNRIYGCDACLTACPWTKFTQPHDEPAFQARAEFITPKLTDLAKLDDAHFRTQWSKNPVKRIGIEKFLRNVRIARTNSGLDD